jgi:hypothetical protein
MKPFAQNFFTHFNARIEPQDNEWMIDLPTELAEVFGKPRLYLVFPGGEGTLRELSPHEDLLVYGSRTFDQMLALLAGRGEMAQIQLPHRFPLQSNQLPAPLTLGNCRLFTCQSHVILSSFYFFNFRAIFRSTEKQEELFTVVLDAAGAPRPDLADIFTGAENLSVPDSPLSIQPDTFKNLLAQANNVATNLAQARATEIETTIAPRLEKTLLRLTTYFRRLTDEVNTGDAEKNATARADLQAELKRQIADELERHRLRIMLKPISYATVQLPFADFEATLTTPHTQQTLTFFQNLHTGQIEGLTCHHCVEPLTQISLCDRQHAAHPHCLGTCHRCERDICHTCGVEPCAVCNQLICVDCVASCRYCKRWLCAAHVQVCAICGSNFCPNHTYHCWLCGQTYCGKCQEDKTCKTCQTALNDPTPMQASLLAWIKVEGLVLNRYQWQSGQNNAHTVYLGWPTGGLSALRDQIVLVVNPAGRVIYRQNIGFFRRFLKRLK